MSLIQEALERTHRGQNVSPASIETSKPIQKNPIDADLEKEVRRVQQTHLKQTDFYKKLSAGIVLLCLVGGIVLWVNHRPHGKGGRSQSIARSLSQKMFFSSTDAYRLTGIMKFGNENMAVINDEIVGVGATLFGKATVKNIRSDEVLLDVRGKEVTLVL